MCTSANLCDDREAPLIVTFNKIKGSMGLTEKQIHVTLSLIIVMMMFVCFFFFMVVLFSLQ